MKELMVRSSFSRMLRLQQYKETKLQIQLSPRIAVHVAPLNEISIVLEG